MGTQSSHPTYDPQVIEQFAENLYRKASSFVVSSIIMGAALGAAFGAVPLTSLGEAWPVPALFGFATLMIGAIFGAAIGYVVGDTRSFGYKLQAQSALCQLQTERNTAVFAHAITARAAAQSQPQQAAVAQPQPHATPPPASPEPPLSPPVSARVA